MQAQKRETCVECQKDFANEISILKHIENDHGILVKRESVSFQSWENFLQWKDEVEAKNFCRFVKRTTTKLKFEEVTYYYCERRGFHVPIDHRKRRERSTGTKKINGYCPAKIIVRRNMSASQIKASYCSSHTHPIEPENLKYSPFSKSIKNAVAEKLAAQIPIDKILKDVRSNKSKEFLEKNQMMTRKDILNIARSKKLQNLNRRSVKNAVQVESFAMQHSESVLLYKREGEILYNCSELKKEDFVLIYMNKKQKENLQKFGNNVLAMDETQGLDEYGFFLHTLMILDNFDQGFPACFLFTNRNDQIIIELLFQCIKDEIGILNANTFMSDMQDKYFNAYFKIMKHKPNFYLYCSWCVKRAWKHNLSKIRDVEKKEETRKKLYFLQESNDVSVFEEKLIEFCNDLDTDLLDFMMYFQNNFVNSKEQWAYCYRQYSGINTNMVLKNFYRQIKHNFGNGSKITRLEDGLALIENYLEHREQSDLINNIKGHLSKKVIMLRKAHDQAKNHLDTKVGIRKCEDNGASWIVESFSTSNTEYIVTNCGDCVPDCKLMCDKCFCCTHMFKCSCQENSIRNIMCKHIHAVCLQQVIEQEIVDIVNSEPEEDVEDDISISSPIAVYQLTEDEVIEPESVENYEEPKMEDVSEQNRKHFESIMALVASSPTKNDFIHKALRELEAEILTMRDQEWKIEDYECDTEEKFIP